MSRYLTESEKGSEILEFGRLRAMRTNGPHRGGTGSPDPDIFPLCDALNQLDGVCTVQSCAGHVAEESDGAAHPGTLWIRLSREMSRAFDERAFELLARRDLIDAVSRRYQPYGHELIEIIFFGNDKGRLGESAAFILGYFRQLAQVIRNSRA